jgi:hypothetical protein
MQCPNHEGAFDCSSFCRLCEGGQEVFTQWELNNEFLKGIIYACEYFRDELGIEDAMETTIAQDAVNTVTVDG